MLTDANWCWLMLIDADSCWLMPLDADWCLEMLIDAYRCWLMLIYADWCSNKVQPGILLSERTSGAFWSILNPINVHLIRKTENYSRNCSGFQGLDVQGSLHPVTPHHSTTPASPPTPLPPPYSPTSKSTTRRGSHTVNKFFLHRWRQLVPLWHQG